MIWVTLLSGRVMQCKETQIPETAFMWCRDGDAKWEYRTPIVVENDEPPREQQASMFGE